MDKAILLTSLWQCYIKQPLHHNLGFVKPDDEFDFDIWERWVQRGSFFGMKGSRIFAYTGHACKNIFEMWSPVMLRGDKWDMTRKNLKYFDTLHRQLEIAKKYNYDIWIALIDDCSLNNNAGIADEALVAPFGINCVQNQTGHRSGALAFPQDVVKAYITNFVTELKEHDNVRYGIFNECNNHRLRINGKVTETSVAKSAERIADLGFLMLDLEVEPEHISWGCQTQKFREVEYRNGQFIYDKKLDLAKQAVEAGSRPLRKKGIHDCPTDRFYREMHTCGEMVGNEGERAGRWIKNGRQANGDVGAFTNFGLFRWGGDRTGQGFFSNDGTNCKGEFGVCCFINEPGLAYARPAASRMYKIVFKICTNYKGKITTHGYPKIPIIENLPENPKKWDCWERAADAMSKGYAAVYGVYPENYGRFPEIVKPEPIHPNLPEPPLPGKLEPRPRDGRRSNET